MLEMLTRFPSPAITRYIKIGRKGEVTQSKGGGSYTPLIKEDKFTIVHPVRNGKNFRVDDSFIPANKLPIMFPLSLPSDNFRAFLGIYSNATGKYLCSGNGVTAQKFNPATQTMEAVPCCPCAQLNADKGCKAHATFFAHLPGVNDALSCSRFSTTSWYGARNLDFALRMLYNEFKDLRKVTGAYMAVEYHMVMHNGKETTQPIVRIGYDEALTKEVSCAILYGGLTLSDAPAMGEEDVSGGGEDEEEAGHVAPTAPVVQPERITLVPDPVAIADKPAVVPPAATAPAVSEPDGLDALMGATPFPDNKRV